jgi:SAM-dependent methyltransferase
MLQWVEVSIPTPFGEVNTLGWGVPDNVDDGTDPALRSVLEPAEDQLGAVCWNSNSAVLSFLYDDVFKRDSSRLQRSVVVELGCGVGGLGIALAIGGARVAITDIKELLPLMRENIRRNRAKIPSAGDVLACAYKWGEPLGDGMVSFLRDSRQRTKDVQFYVVLCDALYGNPKDWPTLLATMNDLASEAERLQRPSAACGEATDDIDDDNSFFFEEQPWQRSTVVVWNFCEQRVAGVEDQFLDLLERSDGRWRFVTRTLERISELSMPVRATKLVRRCSLATSRTQRKRARESM